MSRTGKAWAFVAALLIVAGALASVWDWNSWRAQSLYAQARESASPDQARPLLLQSLRLAPRQAGARLALADLEAEAGHHALAYLYYESLGELHPGMQQAGAGMARILLAEQQWALAEQAASAALQAAPADLEILRLRMRARVERGRHHGARQDAHAVLRAAPEDATALQLLQTHPPPATGEALPLPAAPHRAALANYWPGELAALMREVTAAMHGSDPARALQLSKQAERDYPGTVVSPWINAALAFADGDLERAEAELQRGMQRSPRSSRILQYLPRLWAQRYGSHGALQRLQDLVIDDPASARALELAVQAYREARQPEGVEQLFAHPALQTQLHAALLASRYYRETDQVEQAEAALQRVAADHAQRSEWQLARARLQWQTGQNDQALAGVMALLAADAGQREGRSLLLQMLAAGDADAPPSEQSYALAQQMADDAPDSAPLYDAIGWIALRAGQIRTARAWLNAAVAATPQDPAMRFHLARCQKAQGEDAEALASLRRALDAGTGFSERLRARELLAQWSRG